MMAQSTWIRVQSGEWWLCRTSSNELAVFKAYVFMLPLQYTIRKHVHQITHSHQINSGQHQHASIYLYVPSCWRYQMQSNGARKVPKSLCLDRPQKWVVLYYVILYMYYVMCASRAHILRFPPPTFLECGLCTCNSIAVHEHVKGGKKNEPIRELGGKIKLFTCTFHCASRHFHALVQLLRWNILQLVVEDTYGIHICH